MKLSLDVWNGVQVTFTETADPTIEQVLAAVDKLDGHLHTEVSLSRDEPWEFLTISGGPTYFLVSGEARDEAMVQLTTPRAPRKSVTLVCGGQSSEFQLQEVVTHDKIDGAVQQFFEGLSGKLPLPWQIN